MSEFEPHRRLRGVLLTRRSAFQIYCANRLWERGAIDMVIFEEGQSHVEERALSGDLAKKLRGSLRLLVRPLAVFHKAHSLLNRRKYFGFQQLHDERVLESGYSAVAPGLATLTVPSVNSDQVLETLRRHDPQIVFVFGTALIGDAVMDCVSAPFVNMHWGWSPNYRGEGIVTALAHEGAGALGVTVHALDAGIDSGAILYRARPQVEAGDNFYAIGLRLSRLGTECFAECAQRLRAGQALTGVPQERGVGAFRGSKYMREHPEIYLKAWRNLLRASGETRGGT
ncbi:formyl transferase [Steroidobacter flavus]|uniref:Formyl transferase n=1 Tax=Steroidobacter flavus TaxID=1842136 RepID=A0ABV8T2S9_9GAMM